MLKTTAIPRIFVFDDKGQEIRLCDPAPKFNPEQVMDFYSGTYPILTTAKIEGPEIKGDALEFKFNTTLGTKG